MMIILSRLDAESTGYIGIPIHERVILWATWLADPLGFVSRAYPEWKVEGFVLDSGCDEF